MSSSLKATAKEFVPKGAPAAGPAPTGVQSSPSQSQASLNVEANEYQPASGAMPYPIAPGAPFPGGYIGGYGPMPGYPVPYQYAMPGYPVPPMMYPNGAFVGGYPPMGPVPGPNQPGMGQGPRPQYNNFNRRSGGNSRQSHGNRVDNRTPHNNANRQDGGGSGSSKSRANSETEVAADPAMNGGSSSASGDVAKSGDGSVDGETATDARLDNGDAVVRAGMDEGKRVHERPSDCDGASEQPAGIVFGSHEPVSVSVSTSAQVPDKAAVKVPDVADPSSVAETLTAKSPVTVADGDSKRVEPAHDPADVRSALSISVPEPASESAEGGSANTKPVGTESLDSLDAEASWENSPYANSLTLNIPDTPVPMHEGKGEDEGYAAPFSGNSRQDETPTPPHALDTAAIHSTSFGEPEGVRPAVPLKLSQPRPVHAGSAHSLRPRNEPASVFARPSSSSPAYSEPLTQGDSWRRSTPDLSGGGNVKTTSWKRGVGDTKTQAGPHTSTSTSAEEPTVVVKYDKSTLLGLYTKGKVAPESLMSLYPDLAQRERHPIGEKSRPPQQAPHPHGAAQQSSPRRQGGGMGVGGGQQHQQQQLHKQGGGGKGGSSPRNPYEMQSPHTPMPVLPQLPEEVPHPDEEDLFAANPTKAVFRFDPSRMRDMSLPENKLLRANELLNKLTLEKFDKLSKEFMNIGLDTEELLNGAVDLIVKKAQMEDHLCSMYANLCKTLTDNWSTIHSEQTEELGKLFRQVLLVRCETEFTQDREAAFERIQQMEIPQDEKEEKTLLLKKSYIGHMRFIGEIYLLDLVRAKIMHYCISELIKSSEEEKLVCMCKLLQTIGKQLEEYDNSKKKKTTRDYFVRIAKMSEDTVHSVRLRFMFKDIAELRASGWVARRETEKAKSLSEFRNPEQAGQNAAPGPGSNLPMGSPKVRPGGQDARGLETRHVEKEKSAPAEDEWEVVGGKSSGKKGSASNAKFGTSSMPPPMSTPTTSTRGGGGAGGMYAALSSNKKEKSGKEKDRDREKDRSSSSKDKDKEKDKEKDKKSKKSSSTTTKAVVEKTRSVETSRDSEVEAEGDKADVEGELEVAIECPRAGSVSMEQEAEVDEDQNENVGGGKPVDEKIKSSVEEWVTVGDEAAAVTDFRESYVRREMPKAVQCLLAYAMDRKEAERVKITALLTLLWTAGVLRAEQVDSGFSAFLDDFEDLLVDAPLAESYLATMLGSLLCAGVFRLSVLTGLPEENMFAMSSRLPHLVAKSLVSLSKAVGGPEGEQAARDSLLGTGFSFAERVDPGPKQTAEEACRELLEKNSALFLL